MKDQAAQLRKIMASKKGRAKIIAVTSGKGGVGKTNVTVNLAIAMSQLGKRVVILDADLGLADINVLLDIPTRFNLSHVVAGKKFLREIITPGPGGIGIIPGVRGISLMADLSDQARTNLIDSFKEIEMVADYIILDTGAGISQNVVNFVTAADQVVLVTTPEGTAVTNAYAIARVVSKKQIDTDIRLLVNMARHRPEAEQVANSFCKFCQTNLNFYVGKLGYILSDACVGESVRKRKSFYLEYPKCSASICVGAVARNLVGRLDNQKPVKTGFFERLTSLLVGKT